MTSRIDSFMSPHEIAIAQSRASRNITQIRETTLQSYGLTSPEWLILGYVVSNSQNAGARVGDIARALDVQSTYVTGVLRKLLAKGLVQAQVHPKDRRVRCIAATKHGSALVQAIDSELSEYMGRVVGDASDIAIKNYIEVVTTLAAWNNRRDS